MATRSLRSLFRGVADIATQIGQGLRAPLPELPATPDQPYDLGYAILGRNFAPSDPIPIVQVAKPVEHTLFGDILGVAGNLFKFGNFGGFVQGLAEANKPTGPEGTLQVAGYLPGGTNMGLFDDIWGGVQNAATSVFSGSQNTIDWNNLLNQGVSLATTALAPRPTQTFMPMAQPAALAGAVPRAMIGAGGAVVARGFFNRFPNLAAAIQTLRNSGMNVTRAKLYGVMKRFGPEFLVTGGLLTAAAVNELAVAGPGHRRMNPANVRALRRSVRRIESFHRLCTTTDRLRGRSRRRKC